jgi:tetratricopeptide (TPR) repeat protein
MVRYVTKNILLHKMKKILIIVCILIGNYTFTAAQSDKPIITNPILARLINGDHLAKLGLFEEALNEYDIAVAADAGYVDAYMRRALILAKLGRMTEAIQDYNQAQLIDPYVVEVFDLYGRIKKENVLKGVSKETTQEPTKFLFTLNKRIKTEEGKNPITFFQRGNIFALLGNYKSAFDDFDKAVALDNNYVEAIYNRGVANILLKNNNAACEDFFTASGMGSEKATKKYTFFCNR